jgi:hypothetical protein
MRRRCRAAAVAGTAIFALALTACGPYVGTYRGSGLTIDVASRRCFTEVGTGARLVQFSVQGSADLDWDPEIVGFKLHDAPGISIVGEDVRPPGIPVFTVQSPPTGAELKAMEKKADQNLLEVVVERNRPSTVVLLIHGSPATVGSDSQLEVYWGGGEPVYYQAEGLAGLLSC